MSYGLEINVTLLPPNLKVYDYKKLYQVHKGQQTEIKSVTDAIDILKKMFPNNMRYVYVVYSISAQQNFLLYDIVYTDTYEEIYQNGLRNPQHNPGVKQGTISLARFFATFNPKRLH